MIGIPISSSNPRSQATSLAASANARYMAAYIDIETSACSLLCQLVSEFTMVNVYMDVNLQSFGSLW